MKGVVFESLKWRFARRKDAEADLRFSPNLTVLTGENGSGKTTTLDLLQSFLNFVISGKPPVMARPYKQFVEDVRCKVNINGNSQVLDLAFARKIARLLGGGDQLLPFLSSVFRMTETERNLLGAERSTVVESLLRVVSPAASARQFLEFLNEEVLNEKKWKKSLSGLKKRLETYRARLAECLEKWNKLVRARENIKTLTDEIRLIDVELARHKKQLEKLKIVEKFDQYRDLLKLRELVQKNIEAKYRRYQKLLTLEKEIEEWNRKKNEFEKILRKRHSSLRTVLSLVGIVLFAASVAGILLKIKLWPLFLSTGILAVILTTFGIIPIFKTELLIKKFEQKIEDAKQKLLNRFAEVGIKATSENFESILMQIFAEMERLKSENVEELYKDYFKLIGKLGELNLDEIEKRIGRLQVELSNYQEDIASEANLEERDSLHKKIEELQKELSLKREELASQSATVYQQEKQTGDIKNIFGGDWQKSLAEVDQLLSAYFLPRLFGDIAGDRLSYQTVKQLLKRSEELLEKLKQKHSLLLNLRGALEQKAKLALGDLEKVLNEGVLPLYRKLYPSVGAIHIHKAAPTPRSKLQFYLFVDRNGHKTREDHLSHGEKDQLYILSRLVLAEKIAKKFGFDKFPILLDEPFFSADSRRKLEVWNAILSFAEKENNRLQIIVTALEVPEEIKRRIEKFGGCIIDLKCRA